MDPLHPYVHPSIIPSAKRFGCLVCVMIHFSFFYIQTLYNDFSHIEVVHLLFCAHFINVFLFLGVLNILGC